MACQIDNLFYFSYNNFKLLNKYILLGKSLFHFLDIMGVLSILFMKRGHNHGTF